MPALILYTTSGCHLCEQAQALVVELQAEFSLTLVPVEISEDASLLEIYGIRIPVLRREDGSELGWPFDRDALREFLRNYSKVL